MKLRDVLKALNQLKCFDLIELCDYGCHEGYLLKDLMECVDDSGEKVMSADVYNFSTHNNVVTIWGNFLKVCKGDRAK